MKNDAYKILTGFLVGALGGIVAGLLMAPEKGADTRKKITETANKIKHELEDFAEETIENTKKTLSHTVDDVLKVLKEENNSKDKKEVKA